MTAVDWSKPLYTRDGRFGLLMPHDGLTEKRRVCMARNGNRFGALTDAGDYTLTGADASWALENRL